MHPSEPQEFVVVLMTTGAIAGVAQALLSEDDLTFRLVLGRAVSTAVLTLSVYILPVFLGKMSPLEMLGAGAAIGSLGTRALEIILKRKLLR